MPAIYVWLIVIVLIAVFSVYSLQLAANLRGQSDDAGQALIEFGKAFPQEAVRDVVATADNDTVFLRLYEGKVGCVQYHGRTMSCQLLKPGSVSVHPGNNPNTVHIDFNNSRSDSGEFVFANTREAAEVSLWLLGSFTSAQSDDEAIKPA